MSKRRRLKGKKLILYRINLLLKSVFVFLSFAACGILLTTFLFFKVQSIECIGDSPYEKDEIISTSNLKIGNNLFLLSTKKSAQSIEERFPYLENVKIIKSLPNKLIINIEKANNYLNIEFNNENIILSDKLKVLDITENDVDEAIKVRGVGLKTFEIGKPAIFNEGNNELNFFNVLELLKKMGLIGSTKVIDFTDTTNIIINYDNRINIKLGAFDKMDYKLRTAKELLENKISSLEKGDLDLSMLSIGNRSYFNPAFQ